MNLGNKAVLVHLKRSRMSNRAQTPVSEASMYQRIKGLKDQKGEMSFPSPRGVKKRRKRAGIRGLGIRMMLAWSSK